MVNLGYDRNKKTPHYKHLRGFLSLRKSGDFRLFA